MWPTVEVQERFWSKVRKTDSCWLWTGGKDKDGYGKFCPIRKGMRAHRFAWEITEHKKIPDGMCILHICDAPSCVNPAHLYLGTHADNAADRARRGRNAQGEHSGMAKLNEEQVRAARIAYAGEGVTLLALAQHYKISCTQAWHIVTRRQWAHVA
jgi:hypothetical protein